MTDVNNALDNADVTGNNTNDLVILARDFDRAWNEHNLEEVLTYFMDDAIITVIPTFKGVPGTLSGKDRIRQVLTQAVQRVRTDSGDYMVQEGRITWITTYTGTILDQYGIDKVDATVEALVDGTKILAFTLTVADESRDKIKKAIGDNS